MFIVMQPTDTGMPALSAAWRPGAWAKSGRQDAAHDDLADISTINSSLLNSSPDGGGTQFIGVYSLELSLERSDGCPPGANDYDISHVGSFVQLIILAEL